MKRFSKEEEVEELKNRTFSTVTLFAKVFAFSDVLSSTVDINKTGLL